MLGSWGHGWLPCHEFPQYRRDTGVSDQMMVEQVLKDGCTEPPDTRQKQEHVGEPKRVVRVLEGLVLHQGRVDLLAGDLYRSAVCQGMQVCGKTNNKKMILMT